MTHGCIEEYSRLIIFLKRSDNNRATTVYELFLSAVQQHQLSSCVRTDRGGENVLVAQHMVAQHMVERRKAKCNHRFICAQPANRVALAGHV